MDLRRICRLLQLLPACGTLVSGLAMAADSWKPYPLTQSSHIIQARPAAMGEAFTAVADDQNALYYNPAGLARLNTWYLEVLSLQFGFSHDFVDGMDPIMDLLELDMEKVGEDREIYNKFVEIVRGLIGKPYYGRFGLNPTFVMPNFGLGIYMGAELLMAPSFSTALVQADVLADSDVRFGYGLNLFGKKLSLGAALALRARGHVNFVGSWDELGKYSDEEFNFAREYVELGRGASVDLGMMFQPVETWEPTLGVSIANVGDAKFFPWKIEDIEKAPTAARQAVNLGVSVTPRWGEFFARGAVDFRDVNLPLPASQKLRIGAETGWGDTIRAQLGWMNNAPTAGIEARLFIVNLRYSTYVIERGYAPGAHPGRVHMINLKALL